MSQSVRRLVVPALALLLLAAVPVSAAVHSERTTPWASSILDLADWLWAKLGFESDGPAIAWEPTGASIDPDGRNGDGIPPTSTATGVEGQ